ncbi:MAG: biotin synthase BioB [Deltaproteobacteria bacterium]|jgi:biotin synthase|nr:biotin synthase BioB [Deltaproteobacteria bacterium]
MFERIYRLAEQALRDEPPSRDDALWILDGQDVDLLPLLHAAYLPRERHFGRKVMVQILNNIQNGLCPEDCGYCSQSSDSEAAIRKYPIKSDEEIFAAAEHAARAGASRYCMALSGRGPTLERTRKLAALIRQLKDRYPIEICLSAGLVDDERAEILAEAGLDRLNHNLNTSESHYGKVCSTHSYSDRVRTLEAAHKRGIETCSGFILGMGESSHDVVELAFRLRELEVPSIPVNFLIPIAGNPLQADGSLTPERCLRTLALVRFVNPRAEIRAAGGREGHLRSLEPLALYPANSLFVEGYLTTRGDAIADTYRMIRDAGFEIEGNPLYEAGTEPSDAYHLAGGDGEILKPEIARQG